MLHMIFTRLHPGHLSAHDGDSSWCSGETVKISNCTFQCSLLFSYFWAAGEREREGSRGLKGGGGGGGVRGVCLSFVFCFLFVFIICVLFSLICKFYPLFGEVGVGEFGR